MMRIISTTIIALASIGSCVGQTIALDDILTQVISSSFDAVSASNQTQIARYRYDNYKSQLKPQISASAEIPNFSKTSVPVTQPDGTISFQSISQANASAGLGLQQAIAKTGGTVFATAQLDRFDDLSTDFTQYNGIPFRVGIIQPVLGFNPWKYRKVSEPLLLAEAEKSYITSIEEALTRATQLFFDMVVADQNLTIANTNQTINQRLLTIADERLALGKISEDEKLQLEIEYSQSRLDAMQAQVAKDRAIATLYTYLGQKPPAAIEIELPALWESIDVDISALLAAFRSNRSEIIAYKREVTDAKGRIAETNAIFGPGATLLASFGLARGADNVADIYRDPFTEQQVNLSINIPIVEWGRRKSAVAQEQIRLQGIELSYDQQILELSTSVEQAAYRLASLQNEVKLLQEIMTISSQRATISNERYVLGNIDITNLTIAQREQDQSKRNYINALRSLWVTYHELRALSGYDIITNQDITYNI